MKKKLVVFRVPQASHLKLEKNREDNWSLEDGEKGDQDGIVTGK